MGGRIRLSIMIQLGMHMSKEQAVAAADAVFCVIFGVILHSRLFGKQVIQEGE